MVGLTSYSVRIMIMIVLCRVLVLTSTILFCLCSVHVAASLRQLLEAFVYVSEDTSDYSDLYWLDSTTPLSVLKDVLYDTLVR